MQSSVSSGPDPAAAEPPTDPRLAAHLRAYLGAWPPSGRSKPEVVGSTARLEPAWDGAHILAVVVRSPLGTVISVAPEAVSRVEPLAAAVSDEDFSSRLAAAVGLRGPNAVAGAPGVRGPNAVAGVAGLRDPSAAAALRGPNAVDSAANRVSPWLPLRWSVDPAPLPDAGQWVDIDHPALPEWLRAFPGPVLVALDGEGVYLGGVGMKPHTKHGVELAVGTSEKVRGRGLARRLVAQAARWVLARGVIPLYVHHPDNVPSARVADAAGFPDLGWRLLVVWAATP